MTEATGRERIIEWLAAANRTTKEHAERVLDSCLAGMEPTPMPYTPTTTYRITWRMIPPHDAERLESHLGKEYWPKVPKIEQDAFEWCGVENLTGDRQAALNQYIQLCQWEKDGTQPIRDPKIEVRPEPAWQPLEGIDRTYVNKALYGECNPVECWAKGCTEKAAKGFTCCEIHQ